METKRDGGSKGEWPLSGKRALVVGGTGGIGGELSRLLYARGADLVVHGRSSAKAGALIGSFRREFPESPSSASPLEFPLEPATVERFVREAQGAGPFGILAVAFGPFLQRPLEETGPDSWIRMASLNLALPGALASACLPGMLSSGYGRILLFGGSLTDQIRGFRTDAAYAAAKTGLGSLVKSIARSGAGRGVSCVLVCPGLVETEYQGAAEKAAWAEKAPGKRLMAARSLAEGALGLALDDTGSFNGSIVAMDGGLAFS